MKDQDHKLVSWPQDMTWQDVIAQCPGSDAGDSSDSDIEIVSVQQIYLPKPSASNATASSNALEEVD